MILLKAGFSTGVSPVVLQNETCRLENPEETGRPTRATKGSEHTIRSVTGGGRSSVDKNFSSSEQSMISKACMDYLYNGGFPLVVKTADVELSKQYFEDIVNKDVVNRYKIKQTKEIKDLLLYLFSTTGKTYSYNALKQLTGIKSLSTIKNYIDYFKNVYLLYTIDRFDYSLAKQKISSSKPFVGDTSFLKTIAFNFTENLGQKLENAVFLELVRKKKQAYYYQEKKECDFVVKEGLKITQAIQVCVNLANMQTRQREIEGLLSAMNAYKLRKGIILTVENEETIKKGDRIIHILPLWKWLLYA
jgi:predicted AAA+ superfamily ATPase